MLISFYRTITKMSISCSSSTIYTLPRTRKSNPGGGPATRKKDPPAFKAVGVRQGAAGARQSDAGLVRDFHIGSFINGEAVPAPWQAAAQAAFTHHARRYGTRRLRAELHAESRAVGRYALRT